jgi:outer membrane protein assembly factor BamB
MTPAITRIAAGFLVALLPVFAISAFALAARAADAPRAASDWPQFQGPGASGISPETGLARAWPAGGPRTLWETDVGPGFAGAAVRDGKVYLLDRADDAQDILRCLDLGSGKEEWRFAYDAPGGMEHNGSRQVPAVDEKHIYTVGPFGHMHCIDRAAHKPVWSHNLVTDFRRPPDPADPARPPMWGVSQCPVLYKDTVIVAPQTAKVGVVAYERATGKVRWTSPPVGPNYFCYVTPTRVTLGGTDQVIVMANKQPEKWLPAILSSVDAATGKLLWQLETAKPYKLPVSCPVKTGEDRLFVSGAYRIGCFGLRVSREGERWAVEYAFKDNNNCVAHLHTPILYKGCLYAQSFDIHQPKGQNGLVCLDLDGNIKWKTGPDLVFDAGAILIADGLIYILHGKTGELFLAEVSPDGYKPLARAKVLGGEGGEVWAPMALSDGKLIVRDQHKMKCLDVRKP